MRKIFSISIFFSLIICLNGQTLIDIEVDEIYLDDNKIRFINKGEINSFDCNLVSIGVKDFENKIILDCEEENDWMWSDNPVLIPFNQLKKFDQPEDLIEHIKDFKFAKSSNIQNQKNNSFLQYFNNHLFAKLYYLNFNSKKTNWRFYGADFWNFVYIRINKKYLIIALVHDNYPGVGGYIVPTKDKIIVVSKNFTYEKAGERTDSLNLQNHIPLDKFYRIKKTENGEQITDKFFKEKIIDKHFDKVNFKENYIECYSEKKLELYDKSGKNTNIKNIKAAYDSLGSIQCIINDEVKWVDYKWNIHDTFPITRWGFCGNISSTERKVEKRNNQFYESYETGYWGEEKKKRSILLIEDNTAQELTYLNHQNSNGYDDYSDIEAVFSFPYTYYVLTKNNEQHLLNITNNRDTKELELIIERNRWNNTTMAKDSLNILISNLEDDIEIDILFKGNLESFGYHHPIRFESGGLYGYYPQTKIAKYKRLEKFNFFFAGFEDKDGKIGFVDIYGKEYYK